MKRVLILGGTTEASELAAQVSQIATIDLVVSLAGRTRQPAALPGTVRSGGFGGVVGLADYLRQHAIDLLIDATHPFAAQISWHAAEAAEQVGIPRLLLVRPAWEPQAGDRWIAVDSVAAAAQSLDRAKRVFLTIGRQELAAFAHLHHCWFLLRMIDPPSVDAALPPGEVLLERGPFTLADERHLMIHHAIDTVVSKNSGGAATYAKLAIARELHIPVVMVQRPAMPPGEQVTDVAAAIAWLVAHRHR